MTWLSIPVAIRDDIINAVRSAIPVDSRVTLGCLSDRVSSVNAMINQYPGAITDALEHLISVGLVCEHEDSGLLFYSLRGAK